MKIQQRSLKTIFSLTLIGISQIHASMEWIERRHPIAPREGNVMAYDPISEKIVLYGGGSCGEYCSETWLWDGAIWEIYTPETNPHPRSGYHSVIQTGSLGNVVVCNGKDDNYEYATDMWSWDGADWKLLQESSSVPPFRSGYGIAYDLKRERLIRFGGYDSQHERHNDLWEWDGVDWQELNPSVEPDPRSKCAMAYDSVNELTIMFSGSTLDDTWGWDGHEWHSFNPLQKPSARFGHNMVFDSNRSRIVLFGSGYDSGADETWEWDGSNWSLIDTPIKPPGRYEFAMTFDSKRNHVVIFGGYDGTIGLDDTWTYNGVDWTFIPPPTSDPDWIYKQQMAFDTYRNVTVMWGGRDEFDQDIRRTWEWDGEFWEELFPEHHPEATDSCSMAYDSIRKVTILYGGGSNNIIFGYETWEYDGVDWTLRLPFSSNPPPLVDSDMVYHTGRGTAIVFGGIYDYNPDTQSYLVTHEMWEWDGTDWHKFEETDPWPPKQFGHAMVYDSQRDRIVMYGGHKYYQGLISDETWEWDGRGWILREPASQNPGYLFNHQMVYDSKRQRTVLIGGQYEPDMRKTWEWDGYDWTAVENPLEGPHMGIDPAMAFDSNRGRTVIFPGDGMLTEETWEYYNTDNTCCRDPGVTIDMPSKFYQPGDLIYCNAIVCNNTGTVLNGNILFVILDYHGSYFFGPSFGTELDAYWQNYPSFDEGETIIPVIPEFTWPEGAGSDSGIRFYAGLTDPGMSFLYGDYSVFEFGW